MGEEELQATLDAIVRDPGTAMRAIPTKKEVSGAAAPSPFAPAALADGTYVRQRDTVRKRLGARAVSAEEAKIANNDRPENLVDELRYTSPAAIDAAGLAESELPESPWSDDYWAVYLGILGKRYADSGFPASDDWRVNFDYVQKNPATRIAVGGNAKAIDALSPSEKYDLLIGDAQGRLTAAMWAEGRRYFEETGAVERWMGICHGWAPAAFMLPRPRRVLEALAADGKTRLRFYPSDIKALATLLWANGRSETRFIGGRCGEKSPATDAEGRLVSPSAFDTNPGTWHQCVVNQIGAARRSFVMDATYDYEVWNQPLFAYRYTYFNPKTMKTAATLSDATVARGAFTTDRFRKYRTSTYDAVVGVAMRVKYVVETEPSHAETDMPSRDAIREVIYCYDLELDSKGTIVGGEWYENRHPDFLWTPSRNQRAASRNETDAEGEWRPTAVMPASWRAAAGAAARSSMPLGKIVEQMIQLTAA